MEINLTEPQTAIYGTQDRYRVVVAGRRFGKALALDTPIPTTKGFKTVADLNTADTIYAVDGSRTKVLYKSEVYLNRECFKVHFSDKTSIVADASHDWVVINRRNKESKLTTKELHESYLVKRKDNIKECKWHVVSPSTTNSTKTLPIPPYLLGLWLGDGTSNNSHITSMDDETLTYIKNYAANSNFTISTIKRHPDAKASTLAIVNKKGKPNAFRDSLRDLNIFNNKHIPTSYLFSSKDQRLDLLKGLMDSDGHAGKVSNEFTVCSKALANDTFKLISSLGIRATLIESVAKLNGRVIGPRYRITFNTKMSVFNLTRKVKAQNIPTKPVINKQITLVEKVASVPVQCIAIDHSSHLFLAGEGFIPTHNTYLSAIELFTFAVNNPGSEVWYVAPTYRMAKMIQWPQLKKIVPRHYIEKQNEQELLIKLVNGSTMILKGTDNPDSLRGASISFIVLDEFQDISMDAWTMVLMPACADQRAPALFIGTPKGFNHFYDLYLKGGVDKGWSSFQYTTAQGGNVEADELEMAKHNMSPRQFAQEFEASFETLSNRIFYAFDRVVHLNKDSAWDGIRTLHIGLDFNVGIMAGVVSYLDQDDNLQIFDEIALENSYTVEVAEMLVKRYPRADIVIYPDPSGKSRKTNAIGGLTDHTILQQFGYKIVAPKKALSNADGFANVNMAFMDAKQETKMYINPRCKHTIKTCEGWTYKKGTETPDKESGVDHHGDGVKYLVNALKPVITNRMKMVKVQGF